MRYLIFIVCLFFGCKGLDSSRSLIHNVGFAQGTSYSIKYMSSEDYHHEIDSLGQIGIEDESECICKKVVPLLVHNNGREEVALWRRNLRPSGIRIEIGSVAVVVKMEI